MIIAKAQKVNGNVAQYTSKALTERGIPTDHHDSIMKEWCNKYRTLGYQIEMFFHGEKNMVPYQIII